jgi:hypothetical protein
MIDMVVASKNDIRPSILAYGWHGDSDVSIDPSIWAYGWHGGRVQEWYMSIHFGVWVDLRAGLDDIEERKFLTLPGLELRPLGYPARS